MSSGGQNHPQLRTTGPVEATCFESLIFRELSSETGSNAGWEAKPGLTEGQEEASSTASVTLFTSRLPLPKTQLENPTQCNAAFSFPNGRDCSGLPPPPNSLELSGKPGPNTELKAVFIIMVVGYGQQAPFTSLKATASLSAQNSMSATFQE